MKSWEGDTEQADFIRGNGADDEGAGSDLESDGGKPEVVGGRRNHRGDGPDDAEVAAAVRGGRLRWPVRLSQAPAKPQTDPVGDRGEGAAVLSGEVFRFQRAAFPRKAGRGTGHPTQL